MKPVLAFFGLGAMGEPMAANLLKAGYTVRTAIHRNPAPAKRLESLGLSCFSTPAEAAKEADVVLTILPADPEINSFLTDPALVAALRPGTVLVEMSSATSECARDLEAFFAPKGISIIDAPVSGGVTGAEKGTLTFFGAGDPEAFAAIRPLLEVMGKEIYHLGACGAGKAFKNLNNLLAVGNTVLLSEAFRIAQKEGLDCQALYDVINVSSGTSANFRARWPRMMAADFEGGFQLGLARKDVGNALRLGEGLHLPVSDEIYQRLLDSTDYDTEDMAAVVKVDK